MFYERKIKYLDCMQNGERKSGAGFVKIEVREKNCNFIVQVNASGRLDTADREVLCLGEKTEGCLGVIHLENGRGNLTLNGLNAENMGQSGISYGELRGIRIPLDGGLEVFCKWRESAQCSESQVQDAESVKNNAEANTKEKEKKPEWGETKEAEIAEAGKWEKTKEAEVGKWEKPKMQEVQIVKTVESDLETTMTDSGKKMPGKSPEKPPLPVRQPIKLRESKWQQIASIYPHIKPFRDEREYISIGPGDFVILPEKYYRMANNSFLLHGYHNYEHLILTKVERRGEAIYYIGVPGTYYDREKQVAVMFGFESFECMEEPARQGDFGYYMMRLEL